jgi:hypothetical protein
MSSKSLVQTHPPAGFFCSERSRQLGEPLWGTAPRVDTWLVLEYDAVWGRKALEESGLPRPVKGWLEAQLESLPHARVQFIKRHPLADGISFFVALARDLDPVLYEFKLGSYAELTRLDLAGVVAGEAVFADRLRRAPLFLVCTNGKRDRCCARFGAALYQVMAGYAGADVWQTTHLGGHRFAPTAAFLPHGLVYGRIEPADVGTLVEALREGRVHLPCYRGRSCYDGAVQAAEYLLREQTGVAELDHFRLQGSRAVEEGGWSVAFSAMDGAVHRLRIVAERTGVERYASCAAEGPTEVVRYRLDGYDVTA